MELDVLFFFGHFYESVCWRFVDKGQADTFVRVSASPTHSMNVSYRTDFVFIFLGLRKIDDQRHSTDINTSTDGFSTKKDLNLPISEPSDSFCFGPWAILWVIMWTKTNSTSSMNVIHGNVIFTLQVSLWVIYNKSVFLSE